MRCFKTSWSFQSIHLFQWLKAKFRYQYWVKKDSVLKKIYVLSKFICLPSFSPFFPLFNLPVYVPESCWTSTVGGYLSLEVQMQDFRKRKNNWSLYEHFLDWKRKYHHNVKCHLHCLQHHTYYHYHFYYYFSGGKRSRSKISVTIKPQTGWKKSAAG